MLLTISTTTDGAPEGATATDLGYLLHKHPDRVQEFVQSFGTATVFYPEADEERCTAALLLEIDPIRLARSRGRESPDFSLSQYVNDRPYAASSLLGVALASVFSTARSGTCRSKQTLADAAIPLEIRLPALPCRGGPDIARRVFAPLGWRVVADPIALDEAFPEWGDSRYVALTLIGTVRLAERLSLFQGALTYEDPRFAGYDAAVLMEVVEHVDPSRLAALERVVFGAARPVSVVVTTPNREFNVLYEGLGSAMRHSDHRFEWTRAEFATWAERVGTTYGYTVEHRGVGEVDPELGTPTQLAVFRHG